jgi:hypothetical protein
MGWTTEELGFDFQQKQEIYFFSRALRRPWGEDLVWNIREKSRRKEPTRKTKTQVGGQ